MFKNFWFFFKIGVMLVISYYAEMFIGIKFIYVFIILFVLAVIRRRIVNSEK